MSMKNINDRKNKVRKVKFVKRAKLVPFLNYLKSNILGMPVKPRFSSLQRRYMKFMKSHNFFGGAGCTRNWSKMTKNCGGWNNRRYH